MGKVEDAGSKGAAKLLRKVPLMKAAWEAARPRMKTGFRGFGFGPRVSSAYDAGIDAAVYTPPDPAKWNTNWVRKMLE